MRAIIINQIVIPIIMVAVGTILEIGRRQIKAYLDSKQELIEAQKKALQQSVGIERYNADVALVKQAVAAVEELGKEFDWKGEVKKNKVLKMIEGKTELSDEEIDNIIKAAVLEVNSISKG